MIKIFFPKEEVEKTEDNIAEIVSHHNLQLDELWEKYKVELQESEVIKYLQEENILDLDEDDLSDDSSSKSQGENIPLGDAKEQGIGTLTMDSYLNTELIRRQKEEERQQKEKVEELQAILNIDYEQALAIYNQTATKDTVSFKRPDLYFANRKKNLDDEIREIIVPKLITQFCINQLGSELKKCRLFMGKNKWIANNKNNGAMLAIYFNTYLKNELGKKREEWNVSDYDIAFEKLKVAEEFVEKVLREYFE